MYLSMGFILNVDHLFVHPFVDGSVDQNFEYVLLLRFPYRDVDRGGSDGGILPPNVDIYVSPSSRNITQFQSLLFHK